MERERREREREGGGGKRPPMISRARLTSPPTDRYDCTFVITFPRVSFLPPSLPPSLSLFLSLSLFFFWPFARATAAAAPAGERAKWPTRRETSIRESERAVRRLP